MGGRVGMTAGAQGVQVTCEGSFRGDNILCVLDT